MRTIQIIPMTKATAARVCGSVSQTTKMPCKSSSLPTEACETGYRMAQIEGSICSMCYADKGNYAKYAATIKPAQFARLDAVQRAVEDAGMRTAWISAMVAHIGADEYFRHHDSGDLQGLAHLEMIVDLARATPHCKHWLPTREYGVVKDFIAKHGRDSIPSNLVIRLSAMYPDFPVVIPSSLRDIPNITASNVHTQTPFGRACKAPAQKGECRECRMCWTSETVSYALH